MFYSQTFLARKGPLGTVWCAAHLESRLKKSHYTSTDISSTVDRIMFPEVPIALRMSGHLLLGVVRIYKKKVEYLCQDCGFVLNGLRKALSSTQINLPDNSTTAKFESITLPETFSLDAVDMELDHDLSQDSHTSSQEDITLTDQIPIDRDPYITITFGEDVFMDTSGPEPEDPNAVVRPMEEDVFASSQFHRDMGFDDNVQSNEGREFNEAGTNKVPAPSNLTNTEPLGVEDPCPSNQMDTQPLGVEDRGPSNQTDIITEPVDLPDNSTNNREETLHGRNGDYSSPPEVEVMREAVHISPVNTLPFSPIGQDYPIEKPSDLSLNGKGSLSPINELSGGQPSPFQQRTVPSPSVTPQDAPDTADTHGFLAPGNSAPELNILPSPPVQQQQQRKRRRRNLFDRSTVLSNDVMKRALEDCSDLYRKRRTDINSLSIWKLNNNARKEQVLYEPLVTGLCPDLCNLFSKDYYSTKSHISLEQEAIPHDQVVSSPTKDIEDSVDGNSSPILRNFPLHDNGVGQRPAAEQRTEMEIEQLRNNEHRPSPSRVFLSPPRSVHSPLREHDSSDSPNSLPSETAHRGGTSAGTENLLMPDIALSPGTYPRTYDSQQGASRTFSGDLFNEERTGFSDIPELMPTQEAEDLSFLAADGTPIGSPGTKDDIPISVRTRAVAHYLKNSPLTTSSGDKYGDLSLNKILQGKTRKICSRMFFETLVLKSRGAIDLTQEQPYGDITLKLTPKLWDATYGS